MTQAAPDPRDDRAARAQEQARERAAGAVSDVLLNIEYAVAKARKGHRLVAKDGVDTNAELALSEAAGELEKLRKRLMQDTYFAVDDRLI